MIVLITLGLVACSSPIREGDAASTARDTTKVTSTTVTTSAILSTGDLADPEVREIEIAGRPLVVAWADTSAERSRGLMGVQDLGRLDGMLFDLGTERPVTFTMRNTLLPLDIYFFDSDGVGVGMLQMVPCESEPCPTYSIDSPARYALEVPTGSVDLGPAPELELG